MKCPSFSCCFFVCLAAAGLTPVHGQSQIGPDERVALMTAAAGAYDKGQCGEVLAAYEKVSQVDPKLIDGVSQYRLGFCTARLQRGAPDEHYARAAELLAEQVKSDSAPLDAHFYRVNSLLNLQRFDEANKAAAEAVARWKAGKLVVPESDPQSWFRLGKLFRDSGDNKGALDPFGRALALAENGIELRDAYVERIANASAEAGSKEMVKRANKLLDATRGANSDATLREARLMITAGDLAGARELLKSAKKGNKSPDRMTIQYSLAALERAHELSKWNLEPAKQYNGTDLDALDLGGLQQALRETSVEINQMLQTGEFHEVPRKNKNYPGMRIEATPEVTEQLKALQSKMTGLLVEAVRRAVPLRQWAVSNGFARLTYHSLPKLFRQAARQRAADGEQPQPGQSSVDS